MITSFLLAGPNLAKTGNVLGLKRKRGDDMSNIGSTKYEDSDPIPKDVIEGSTKQKKATVDGLQLELEVVKQKLENCHEQMRRLIGNYQNLQAEFTQFKQQWAIQLNAFVNGGPTERLNGADDRSSN